MSEEGGAELREGALTFARIKELHRSPVKGDYDIAHLKEIHRRIFQDLPHHWPGEFRPPANAHIKARQLDSSGIRYHVPYANRAGLEPGLERIFEKLARDNRLQGLPAARFALKLAELYGDLDHLHPFREGNSRTLRTFTRQLARDAGLKLDWGLSNQDPGTRDSLYMARDREVIQRTYPGLDAARAATTHDRMEYEAFVRVMAASATSESLAMLIAKSIHPLKPFISVRLSTQKLPAGSIKPAPKVRR